MIQSAGQSGKVLFWLMDCGVKTSNHGQVVGEKERYHEERLDFLPIVFVMIRGISACTMIKHSSSEMTGTEHAEELGRTMDLVETDLATACQKYGMAVKPTQEIAQRFYANADLRNPQSRECFNGVQTQGNAYADTEVQAHSEEQSVEMITFNTDIAASSIGIEGSLENYFETITELDTCFSTDLTQKGVDAIRIVAQANIHDGIYLIASIENLYRSTISFHGELMDRYSK